ncbi:hypothetical protein RAS1_31670 [Phycisphaerae bacterium RAS1]|nr:hypothetical protein RAS1_31670 [Phycisphaerae bacterium RAS1]
MRPVFRVAVSTLLAALSTSAVGCAAADPGAANPLVTFSADFLRQWLAAFLL